VKEVLDAYRVKTIALAWYTPESWERLRAVADDRAALGSHAAFVRKADRLAREYQAQGFAVEKILVDIDELAAWCRREGVRITQRSRATYGAVQAARMGDAQGHA